MSYVPSGAPGNCYPSAEAGALAGLAGALAGALHSGRTLVSTGCYQTSHCRGFDRVLVQCVVALSLQLHGCGPDGHRATLHQRAHDKSRYRHVPNSKCRCAQVSCKRNCWSSCRLESLKGGILIQAASEVSGVVIQAEQPRSMSRLKLNALHFSLEVQHAHTCGSQ